MAWESRSWEGRFKSQALLDEKALAACMTYVDLNPIRARKADTPETSEFTSAKRRIQAVRHESESATPVQPKPLFPFVGYPSNSMPSGLPFRLQDYLELLDWTGRQLRKGKRGTMDSAMPPILDRLNIDPEKWVYTTSNFERSFKGFVGSVKSMVSACRKLGYQRTPGLSAGELLT